MTRRGGRARLKASDSKSDRGVSPSGVQILSPPPLIHSQPLLARPSSPGALRRRSDGHYIGVSYQVLARKWRPQTFDAVVGQDAITRTLRNALASGRVAHAYLFAGPRGVGKTTTARLLAKALLCPERTGAEACGTCSVCRDANLSIDVIEIDGASNRGIEEIRTLRENVKYAPSRGRYKVYIIDEVHQLTEAAFNALLKTLEEPPAHVVFVLATTDPRDIPATVLSRVQRCDFRPT